MSRGQVEASLEAGKAAVQVTVRVTRMTSKQH